MTKSRILFSKAILLFLLIFGPVLVPAITLLDAYSCKGPQFSEFSCTEISQELLLLLSILIFARLAKAERTRLRAPLVLLTGFLACMFCRELDYFFDFIFHGSWAVFAFLCFLLSISYVLRTFSIDDMLKGFYQFINNSASVSIVFALNVILVFSRLLGMKKLWNRVFDQLDQNVNHAVEPLLCLQKNGVDLSAFSNDAWVADNLNTWTNHPAMGQISLPLQSQSTPFYEGICDDRVSAASFPQIDIDYRLVKTFVEESLELYGYLLLVLAGLFFWLSWYENRISAETET